MICVSQTNSNCHGKWVKKPSWKLIRIKKFPYLVVVLVSFQINAFNVVLLGIRLNSHTHTQTTPNERDTEFREVIIHKQTNEQTQKVIRSHKRNCFFVKRKSKAFNRGSVERKAGGKPTGTCAAAAAKK